MAKKIKRTNLSREELLRREQLKSISASFTEPNFAEPKATSPRRSETKAVAVHDHRTGQQLTTAAIVKGISDRVKDVVQGEQLTNPPSTTLLLTLPELCDELRMSRSAVLRLESAGILPGKVKLGGAARYHRETIMQWLRDLAAGKDTENV